MAASEKCLRKAPPLDLGLPRPESGRLPYWVRQPGFRDAGRAVVISARFLAHGCECWGFRPCVEEGAGIHSFSQQQLNLFILIFSYDDECDL